MAWPGTMYLGTFLVGLGYGAHWAIVPAAVFKIFGVKHFGAMYNFLTVTNPTGSLIFSGVIASNLYDYEAEKQAHHQSSWSGRSLQNLSLLQLLADGPLECEGTVCFFVSSLIMSAFLWKYNLRTYTYSLFPFTIDAKLEQPFCKTSCGL
ncbi:hypothetical protein ABZP36_001571 [Zizania latifolia]